MRKNEKKQPELRFPEFTDDWEQRKFGDDLKNIQTGTNKLGSTENTGMPLLKMGNIQRGYFLLDKIEYLQENDEAEPENVANKGDFFFNTRNTLELVGKGATWFGESGKYAFNSNIARFDLGEIDTVFFNYLYNTETMQKQVHARAMGTTSVAAIYPRTLDSITYYLPCKDEQLKIGEYLYTIDHLITLHQCKLEKLKEMKKGVMQKLFSQEVRFKADDGSEFPDWEEKKLGEITSIHARIGWQNLRKDEFLTEGTYLLITGTDFCDGHVNYSTCYYVNKERYEQDTNIQVKNGTILVTKDGTLGKVALIKKLDMPATLNAGVFAINVLDATMNEEYLYHYLAAPMLLTYAKKHSTGGTIKHLNQGIIVDFPVACPCLAEQQKIADCLSSLDDVIEKQKATLAAWKEMKKGLLQKMFV